MTTNIMIMWHINRISEHLDDFCNRREWLCMTAVNHPSGQWQPKSDKHPRSLVSMNHYGPTINNHHQQQWLMMLNHGQKCAVVNWNTVIMMVVQADCAILIMLTTLHNGIINLVSLVLASLTIRTIRHPETSGARITYQPWTTNPQYESAVFAIIPSH